MCDELRARAGPGAMWHYPNSGVFAGTVAGVRLALERLRMLVLQGHFEDQGMFGLAMLQHARGAIVVDSNASLFASQYGYDATRWARPACFHDYFDEFGEPPSLLATGAAPFALHFNGPSGRWRLGWCIKAIQQETSVHRANATAGPGIVQPFYIDVDAGDTPISVPINCEDDEEYGRHRKGASPPRGRRVAKLPPCDSAPTVAQQRLGCSNDRCWATQTVVKCKGSIVAC